MYEVGVTSRASLGEGDMPGSLHFKCTFGKRLLKALKVSYAVLKAELDIFDLIVETEVR